MISSGGAVYFAQCDFGGPIKIGYSCRPDQRVDQQRPELPFTLVLIGHARGEPFHERFLHMWFRPSLIRGEWFSPVPELWRAALEARTKGRLHFLPPAPPRGAKGNPAALAHLRRWTGISTPEIAEVMGLDPAPLLRLHEMGRIPGGKYQGAGTKYLAALSVLLVRRGHSGDLSHCVDSEPYPKIAADLVRPAPSESAAA